MPLSIETRGATQTVFLAWWFLSIGVITRTSAFTPAHHHRHPALVHQQVTQRRRRSELYVVADAPKEEKDKKKRKKDNNKGDYSDNGYGDDWIPTASGGFLPNFSAFRRLKRIVSRGNDNSVASNEVADVSHYEAITDNSINTFLESSSIAPPQTKIPIQSPVIHEVLSMEEYKSVVVDEPNLLVVVRFYAPWCRACKAVAPRFRSLQHKFSHGVKFVEVPLTKENVFLHEGLGIPSLPYAHIYHPDVGLVEELKMNQNVFTDFVHTLKTYVQGYCDVPEDD